MKLASTSAGISAGAVGRVLAVSAILSCVAASARAQLTLGERTGSVSATARFEPGTRWIGDRFVGDVQTNTVVMDAGTSPLAPAQVSASVSAMLYATDPNKTLPPMLATTDSKASVKSELSAGSLVLSLSSYTAWTQPNNDFMVQASPWAETTTSSQWDFDLSQAITANVSLEGIPGYIGYPLLRGVASFSRVLSDGSLQAIYNSDNNVNGVIQVDHVSLAAGHYRVSLLLKDILWAKDAMGDKSRSRPTSVQFGLTGAFTASAVPELASFPLMAIGLLAMGLVSRSRLSTRKV